VTDADLQAGGVAGDTARRNTALSVLALVGPSLLTFGLTLYLVRALGPSEYGVFALALAVGLLLLLPSDLGVTHSAARYVAEHRGDAALVARVLADGLRLKLLGALVVCAGLFAAAGAIAAAYDEPSLTWPLRAMALAVFAQSLMAYWNTAFVALRRVSLNLRVVLSESVAEVGASVALVALGAGAAGAAFGRAAGFAFGALVALFLVYRLLGGGALAVHGSGSHARRIAKYAGALVVVDLAYSALLSVDSLVIGAVLEAEDVGLFQAPYRLAYALAFVGLAFANGIAPRMSRTGDGPDATAFVAALRYLVPFQVAFAVPLLVWAEPIVHVLLGEEYDDSVEVLRALAVFAFAAGFSPLFSLSANYLGEARRRIPIAIAALLVNLVVDLALIPEIGIIGAAIGTNLAVVLYTGAHLWLCDRVVGLPLRRLAPTLVRSVVAGAAMAGVLLLLGTMGVGLPLLIAGGILSAAVFAGALVALGEFSRSELGAARAWVGRRLP
jgi:O-antigen/teichoic acid export membrane protein